MFASFVDWYLKRRGYRGVITVYQFPGRWWRTTHHVRLKGINGEVTLDLRCGWLHGHRQLFEVGQSDAAGFVAWSPERVNRRLALRLVS